MILDDIIRNYELMFENPHIAWWIEDMRAEEFKEQQCLQEAVQRVIFCNLGHYLATQGWIV